MWKPSLECASFSSVSEGHSLLRLGYVNRYAVVHTGIHLLLCFFSQGGIMLSYRINATLFEVTINATDVHYINLISSNMFIIMNTLTGLLFVPLVNHLFIPCIPSLSMRGRMAVGMVVNVLAIVTALHVHWAWHQVYSHYATTECTIVNSAYCIHHTSWSTHYHVRCIVIYAFMNLIVLSRLQKFIYTHVYKLWTFVAQERKNATLWFAHQFMYKLLVSEHY